MGHTNLRSSLQKRYAGLVGKRDDLLIKIERTKRDITHLAAMEAEIPQLDILIEAAETLIKDNDPSWSADDTPGVRPWTHHIPVPFGQCGRRGLATLRNAERPMSVRQVAIEVLSDCGVDDPEAAVLHRVQNAIESSFRHYKNQTVTSSGRYPAQWRAINKPGIQFDP